MTNTKLNLGSGYDYKEGWINVDIDPETQPDIVSDLQEPLPFMSESVDEINLQDVIEHVTKEQSFTLLTECYRVLKVGGNIRIRVPNVLNIVHHFAYDSSVMMEFLYGSTDQNGVWGAHKQGFTEGILKNRLKQIGFSQITIKEVETNLEAVATKKKVNEKLHIMVIQQSPDWGGAEEWMASLVKGFIANNHRVTTITNLPSLQQSFKESGATVISLPFVLDIIGNVKGLIKSIFLFVPTLLFYFRQLMKAKKQKVSVILMSGFSEKLLVSWIAYLINIPVVWYEYGPLNTVFKRNFYLPKCLYRLTKRIPKRLITISRNTKNHLIPETRISLSKVRLIYPGVPIPRKSEAKKLTKTVGSLSRITPEKGQRELLYAWQQVVKHHPDATLKIAGKGDELANLKRLVDELKIGKSVEFLGFIEDKASFYNSIDVFVFPSKWEMEGFGLVAAEAMSYNKPVVGFKTGPLSEIVSKSTGRLVAPVEIQELADTLVELLNHPESLFKMGEKARERAVNKFNLDQQVEKVLKELLYVVRENA